MIKEAGRVDTRDRASLKFKKKKKRLGGQHRDQNDCEDMQGGNGEVRFARSKDEEKDEGNGAMKEGRTNGRHRQFFKILLNVF